MNEKTSTFQGFDYLPPSMKYVFYRDLYERILNYLTLDQHVISKPQDEFYETIRQACRVSIHTFFHGSMEDNEVKTITDHVLKQIKKNIFIKRLKGRAANKESLLFLLAQFFHYDELTQQAGELQWIK
jgi:hypothetical protein